MNTRSTTTATLLERCRQNMKVCVGAGPTTARVQHHLYLAPVCRSYRQRTRWQLSSMHLGEGCSYNHECLELINVHERRETSGRGTCREATILTLTILTWPVLSRSQISLITEMGKPTQVVILQSPKCTLKKKWYDHGAVSRQRQNKKDKKGHALCSINPCFASCLFSNPNQRQPKVDGFKLELKLEALWPVRVAYYIRVGGGDKDTVQTCLFVWCTWHPRTLTREIAVSQERRDDVCMYCAVQTQASNPNVAV